MTARKLTSDTRFDCRRSPYQLLWILICDVSDGRPVGRMGEFEENMSLSRIIESPFQNVGARIQIISTTSLLLLDDIVTS